ncbi:hypothetical protein MYAM1_002968 [Malassezia yamatoensis]|uniref:EF-hand domain-containing protein n=1 Tax=Malassezia yamatoensis TaxID=253288 RepID=A0AAJ5YTP1_9BASI|nr:hypothetical protein MYAM1_002968 [Malassezia yamatoensis]
MAGLESLSGTQIKQLQRVFYAADRDHDDCITQPDLIKTLQSLGVKDAAQVAPTYLSSAVIGSEVNDARLDSTSFLTMMGQHLAPLGDTQKLLEAFESFDERDQGYVRVEAVREILAGDQDAADRILVQRYMDRSREKFYYRKYVAMLAMCSPEELT